MAIGSAYPGDCKDPTSAVGGIVPFQFEVNGNTSDKWLGYSNSAAPSNEIPMVVVHDCNYVGYSFSNRDDDVDIDIEVYKNGALVITHNVRNKRWFYETNFFASFVMGDKISIFFKKYVGGSGDQTAQDPVVTIYTKWTNEVYSSGGAQSGVT